MINKIGFMQGRLSRVIDGKIQAFPINEWQNEFEIANNLGLRQIEWTVDHEKTITNPIFFEDGREQISYLQEKFNISIPSVTADSMMQKPFWKSHKNELGSLIAYTKNFIRASFQCGIKIIVVPIVDNGAIETAEQQKVFKEFFEGHELELKKQKIRIAFETEMSPINTAKFIEGFSPEVFGINFDIGNSAARGYECAQEFRAYGQRIINVHVKDRVLNGPTVPLGHGNANFEDVFFGLKKIGYRGNFILQTARADDGNHVGAIRSHIGFVNSLISQNV